MHIQHSTWQRICSRFGPPDKKKRKTLAHEQRNRRLLPLGDWGPYELIPDYAVLQMPLICSVCCACRHLIYFGHRPTPFGVCGRNTRVHTGGMSAHNFFSCIVLHLPSEEMALIFIARRGQRSLLVVDRESRTFCTHCWAWCEQKYPIVSLHRYASPRPTHQKVLLFPKLSQPSGRPASLCHLQFSRYFPLNYCGQRFCVYFLFCLIYSHL